MTRKQELLLPKILIKALSAGQREVIQSIANNTVTICTGMAGTGKTHLAVTSGLKQVIDGTVGRLVVTRPIVDSGSSIGFLPGDVKSKIDPYMMPVYDIIGKYLSRTSIETFIHTGTIELAPLNYMRGRTLGNCFAILDEAQNTTITELKMFLTRLGPNSKFVICGDLDQCDINNSGLIKCVHALSGLSDVNTINLETADIVRHPLIGQILDRLRPDTVRSPPGILTTTGR